MGRIETAADIYPPDMLRSMPTLCTGQCCSLKIDQPGTRVWLCRVAGGVTIERYNANDGCWETVAGSCTCTGKHKQ